MSPIADGPHVRYRPCAVPDCKNTFRDVGRWSKTDGWFTQKNGLVWCPDHVPDWVAEWRYSRGVRAVPQ